MSTTCEKIVAHCRCGEIHFCGEPTKWRYPAMGGGYAHLCDGHAAKYLLGNAALIGMELVEPPRDQTEGA